MKKNLLVSTLTLVGSLALAADPETAPKPEGNPQAPHPVTSQIQIQALPGPPSKAEASPAPTVTGKATITIEVNGQKQTREIDLGDSIHGGTTINGGTINVTGRLPNGGVPTGTTVQVGSGTLTFSPNGGQSKMSAVRRTWLGVSTDELSGELHAQLPVADGLGLLVRSVVADSPAAHAGLQANDVLTKFDDQLLANPDQLRALVGTKKEGDAVHLTYLRRGQEATAEVKLGTHEEGGAVGQLNLTPSTFFLGNGNPAKGLEGLGNWGAAITDKDGRVVIALAHPEIGETVKQLDKALRDAGLDEKTIEKAKQAVMDAIGTVQRAAGDVTAAQADVARELRKAVEDAKKAAEQAQREAADAIRNAVPPAPKAP